MWQRIIHNWRLVTVAVLATAVVAVSPVQATTVTSANDYVTSLETSAAGNHTVIFTTPNSLVAGETITLTFDSSFDTSSITEDDIDFEDDDVDETTVSTCTGGGDEILFGIASDVVTLTLCAGHSGMSSSSVITIEIGDHATAGGTGSNQITNPSSAGTYFVSIAGTFDGDGSIALPISSQGAVTVTGTVAADTSGGPGGGGDDGGEDPPPPGGDQTPPSISNIVVAPIGAANATINWDTDEEATSQVEYGLTEAFGTSTSVDPTLELAHTVGISELSSGTTYYFRVKSTDSSGNEAVSATQTFTTTDKSAPVLSNVTVTDVTQTSARVTWQSDELSTSTVEYGLDETFGTIVGDAVLVTDHSVLLTNLTPATEYYFRVHSADASSNTATSATDRFVTDANAPPANVTNFSIEAGNAYLSLTWSNPADEDLAGVRIIRCKSSLPVSHEPNGKCKVEAEGLFENLEMGGLKNGTEYFFGVFAFDSAGLFASGALGSGIPTASEPEQPIDPPDDPCVGDCGDDGGDPPPGDDDGPPGDDGGGPPGGGDEPPVEDDDGDDGGADAPPEEDDDDNPPIGGGLAPFDLDDIAFRVAKQQIELQPLAGVVDVLGGTVLHVEFNADGLNTDEIASIVMNVGSESFLMKPSESEGEVVLYTSDIITPTSTQPYVFELTVNADDGTEQSVSSLLRVVNRGRVYEDIDGEEANIQAATVTLLAGQGDSAVVWDGSPYGQFNPLTVGPDGTYGWYVQNGSYVLRAQAEAYGTYTSDSITVLRNIVNESALLVPLVKEEPKQEPVTDEKPVETQAVGVTEVVSNALEQVLEAEVVEVVSETIEAVREIPAVQTSADIAAPTLVATAGASVVVLAVAFDFLPFLQYLFTAPILFFARRRRESFGVVFNAYTKAPVDLAVVRLFSVDPNSQNKRGRLVKSRVTDKAGRFFFLTQPGNYRLEVTKRGFTYPSDYLKEKQEDGEYLDLYHGETITVAEKDAVITPNVPLDPKETAAAEAPKRALWMRRLRIIQNVIALIGVLGAVAFAVIRPSVLAVVMIIAQIVIYFLARRLAKPAKPKSWGIVYDKSTKRPMAHVVARIFEPKYNKLLDTQVTDSKGRYAFLLGPSEYYAVFEKDGYRSTQVRPIKLDEKGGTQDFSIDIEMTPHQEGADNTPPTSGETPA